MNIGALMSDFEYLKNDISKTTTIDRIDLSFDCALYAAHYTLPLSKVSEFLNDDHLKDFIKGQIALELARTLVNSSIVDFTYTKNLDDTTTVRAKTFITRQKDTRVLIDKLRKTGMGNI